jgi:hypothetical protein
LGAEETSLMEGQVIFGAPFCLRVLDPPIGAFFHEVLNFYGIKLHHLNANFNVCITCFVMINEC